MIVWQVVFCVYHARTEMEFVLHAVSFSPNSKPMPICLVWILMMYFHRVNVIDCFLSNDDDCGCVYVHVNDCVSVWIRKMMMTSGNVSVLKLISSIYVRLVTLCGFGYGYGYDYDFCFDLRTKTKQSSNKMSCLLQFDSYALTLTTTSIS